MYTKLVVVTGLSLASALVVATPRADAQCLFSATTNLNDGDGFLWDIDDRGAIGNGTGDSYDVGMALFVDGVPIPQGQPQTAELGGRQIVTGPLILSGLQVTRRVFVPATDAFARFRESFTNPTGAPITVIVQIQTNPGSDSGTVVTDSHTGDTVFTTADRWVATDDSSDGGGDLSLTHNLFGPAALVTPSAVGQVVFDCATADGISFDFVVTVPPGATRHIMHFGAQSMNRAMSSAKGIFLDGLPAIALTGLSADDIINTVNWDPNAPTCGDGNVGAGEQCDDAGESANCDADCTLAVCGDGTTNATRGEQCDDAGESATCDADCTLAVCGDGAVNMTRGEECDDAGESATCDADCTAASCGDGTTNATRGEECDDGGESAACDTDCTAASCGDGTTNATRGEECDDSGESPDCDTDCTDAFCGDSTTNVTRGEECDDAGESMTCDLDCTAALCGDGVTNGSANEACDDGNDVDDDACNNGCTINECGNGVVDPGEECDDGLGNSDGDPDACRTRCLLPGCGDGVVDALEECDDGEANSDTAASACRTSCALATCGDGVTDSGEACDDGEANSDTAPGACRTTCSAAACGDGVLDDGEACDEGSGNGGATCDETCNAVNAGCCSTNKDTGPSGQLFFLLALVYLCALRRRRAR